MKGLIMGLWIGGFFLLISACGSSDSAPVNDGGLTGLSQESDGQESEEGRGEEPVAECPPLPPVLENSRVTVQGTEFVDDLGRVVLFRGINGGGRSKFPPFLPFDFAESETEIYEGALPFADAVEQYANRIESWGHNVVRLPFTWEALEPVRDAFDEAWLSRYEALVNALTARDIYVIVDFHQDVYSRAFCGDGFPFSTLSEPPSEFTPMEECAEWFLGYIIPGPSRDAFDRFWNNEDNLHVEFQDMWIHMIERFKDNERVLGFELMNEPGAGNANEATFVATTLSDFYNESIGVLREKATPATLFFDSTGLEGVSSSTSLVRPDGEGLAFAPHYYDPVALLSAGEFEAAESYKEPIGKWRIQGDAWNMPVLLGEFGARRALESAGEFIEKAFDALDAHLLHGTAWEYSESALEWNMEGLSIYTPWDGEFPTAKATIRAYPSAVAGELLSFHFDAETRKRGVGIRTVARRNYRGDGSHPPLSRGGCHRDGCRRGVLYAPGGCREGCDSSPGYPDDCSGICTSIDSRSSAHPESQPTPRPIDLSRGVHERIETVKLRLRVQFARGEAGPVMGLYRGKAGVPS